MAIPSRSAEKAEFWRMVLEEHRNSGLTIKAFCARQGVSEQSFYSWRRKLRRSDQPSGEPIGLVPVTIVDHHQPAVDRNAQVQIVTPGGFVLRVGSSIPESELASLVRAIEPARCEDPR